MIILKNQNAISHLHRFCFVNYQRRLWWFLWFLCLLPPPPFSSTNSRKPAKMPPNAAIITTNTSIVTKPPSLNYAPGLVQTRYHSHHIWGSDVYSSKLITSCTFDISYDKWRGAMGFQKYILQLRNILRPAS